jgi:hypothetical protein
MYSISPLSFSFFIILFYSQSFHITHFFSFLLTFFNSLLSALCTLIFHILYTICNPNQHAHNTSSCLSCSYMNFHLLSYLTSFSVFRVVINMSYIIQFTLVTQYSTSNPVTYCYLFLQTYILLNTIYLFHLPFTLLNTTHTLHILQYNSVLLSTKHTLIYITTFLLLD